LSAGLMGVEGGWGGVHDVYGAQDADLVALLAVQLLGDGLEGDVTGPGGHVDDAGLGLFARSDGGGGGSGVGSEGGGVIGGDAADEGELHEAQLGGGHSAVVLRSEERRVGKEWRCGEGRERARRREQRGRRQ